MHECFYCDCIIGPTQAPPDVTYFTTSTNITVYWEAVECIESNGEIIGYMVSFRKQNGAIVPSEMNVTDRVFTATGLHPFTNYVFKVAAVNDVDVGPFTSPITITTDEEGM